MSTKSIGDNEFAVLVSDEYDTLPEIYSEADYAHFKEQLVEMRAREIKRTPKVEAMETALFLRLLDYEVKAGIPESEMPEAISS